MKPTLVTGANGHVGNNVCRQLVERGERVRAMLRATADPAALRGLDLEVVRGDILDPTSTAAAVAGCGRVYHTAAGFLLWARDPQAEVIRPSVEGTRNVVTAAVAAGVEKVLYVSTGGTIGFADHPSEIRDETAQNTAPHTDYFRGKIAAEAEAFSIGARAGLPVTAVNPGFIIGPRFWKLSESVKQVADLVNQGLPFYFDGGFGAVDVEDVARGAVLAMDGGRPGERYILSGENLTLKALLDLVADLTGVGAPQLRLPVPVVRVAALAMELVSRVTGTRPLVDRHQVDEFAGRYGYLSAAKAERELGWSWRPARAAVSRTIAWLLDHGFVPAARRRVLTLHPSLRNAY